MKNYLLIINMSFQSILASKLRSFLTILGIMIGVSSVVAIVSIGAGAESLISGSIQNLGTNVVSIMPGKSDDNGPPASAFGIVITSLSEEDAEAIAKLPHIFSVAAYARGNGDLSAGSRSIAGNFTGVSANYQEVEDHQLVSGRFFNEREERGSERVAVLGIDVKDELFPLTDPVGERVKINGLSHKIIGVLERKGSFFVFNPDNQIYVPLSTAQNLLLGEDHLGMIRLRVDNEENVELAINNIRQELRARHKITDPENDDFTVRSFAQALDVLTGVIGAVRFFLVAIAAVSLLVGGIGITNIMLMTVQERTREIGLRKAIGARPRNIKNQFVLEALVLTLCGGLMGILIGMGISFAIAVVAGIYGYAWEFVLSVEAMGLAFGISVFIGIVFGTYPAKKAARLNPIDALRYE